jgi:D-alanyl-D-alanine carboxypeptidase
MRVITGIAFILLFLFLYFAGIPLTKDEPSNQVDKFISEQMQRFQIAGLTLAVVKDGEIVKARGYGYANLEMNVPAQEDNVYQIASVTKQFTATAIMMLVEENKINLDDKISQYIADLPLDWQNIKIHHLLTHTSGIVNYTELPEYGRRNLYPVSKEEVIKLVAKYPVEFQPGDAWKYSNTGYFLLGMIVEKVSGKSFQDFLKERIFTPLKMKSTSINDLNDVVKNRASGYNFLNSERLNARYPDMSWVYAAGAINSTVTDLARWDAALYTEQILTRKSLEQMWTPVTLNNGKSFPYGFGWGVGIFNGHRVVGHNGGIPGFCSNITRFLDDDITVIIFINQIPAPVNEFTVKVASFYIKGLLPPNNQINNKNLPLNLTLSPTGF